MALSEWVLDDSGFVRLRVSSLPTFGAPFADWIETTAKGTVHYVDDATAASTETLDDPTLGPAVVVRLYRHAVDRVVFAQLSYPTSQGDGVFVNAIPHLESLARTPYDDIEKGVPSAEDRQFWRNKIDAQPLPATAPPPEELAECMAAGAASQRLGRYGEINVDLATIDPDDEREALQAANYYADFAEILFACGLGDAT